MEVVISFRMTDPPVVCVINVATNFQPAQFALWATTYPYQGETEIQHLTNLVAVGPNERSLVQHASHGYGSLRAEYAFLPPQAPTADATIDSVWPAIRGEGGQL